MMGWHAYPMYSIFGNWWWVAMFLFWIAIIGGIAWFMVNSVNRGRTEAPVSLHTDNSVELLNERYARGEIDREKYLLMRRDIERGEMGTS